MNQEVNKIQIQTPIDVKAIKTIKTLWEIASTVEKLDIANQNAKKKWQINQERQ